MGLSLASQCILLDLDTCRLTQIAVRCMFDSKYVNDAFSNVPNSCTVQCMLVKRLLVTHRSTYFAPNSTSTAQTSSCA